MPKIHIYSKWNLMEINSSPEIYTSYTKDSYFTPIYYKTWQNWHFKMAVFHTDIVAFLYKTNKITTKNWQIIHSKRLRDF